MENNNTDKKIKYPNLYEIGTNELTQDIFLTWLFKWGNNEYNTNKLHELSREFLNFLIDKNIEINKVDVKRQWNKIDISVTVNDKYFIIIEDKVNAKEHGNQLERYKKEAEKYVKNKNLELICIYLKIEDENGLSVKKVESKGYRYIYRGDILNILEKYKDIDNNIFQDYYLYISNIEKRSKEFLKDFSLIAKSYRVCRGFFKKFEEDVYINLPENRKNMFEWRYVSQKNDGFYGLWYYPITLGQYSLYIQLEINNKGSAKVVLKTKAENVKYLHKLYKILSKNAEIKNIKVHKPAKFSARGNTSTAVVFNDVIDFSKDYEYTLQKLKEVEQYLENLDITI